jgi:hypothetical protein
LILFKWFSRLHAPFLVVILSSLSRADDLQGYWLTRKLDSDLPSSIIHLDIAPDGILHGQVVAGFYEADAPIPDRVCKRCNKHSSDGRYGISRNQEIVGSYAVWGFEQQSPGFWVAGNVVRVRNGKRYNANLQLRKPNLLNLTVFFGIFHWTLQWERLSEAQVRAICKSDISSVSQQTNVRSYCIGIK